MISPRYSAQTSVWSVYTARMHVLYIQPCAQSSYEWLRQAATLSSLDVEREARKRSVQCNWCATRGCTSGPSHEQHVSTYKTDFALIKVA